MTQLPVLVSHAATYRDAPRRLSIYATDTVYVRLVQYGYITMMHVYNLVGMYLSGAEGRNPMPIYSAARSLVEIYAVAASVHRTLTTQAEATKGPLVDRVAAVDDVLIRATNGTRSESLLAEIQEISGGSKLRAMDASDQDELKARNVLTAIQHLDRLEHPGALALYEQLCEYVHPNIGLNWMYYSLGDRGDTLRLSAKSTTTVDRALLQTAPAMATMARAVVDLCHSMPFPFGDIGRYDRRMGGLAESSLAEAVLSAKALPAVFERMLQQAPRVNCDEVAEFYFARSSRDMWPVAGLKPGPLVSGGMWLEMIGPTAIVTDAKRWSAQLLPDRWGALIVPANPALLKRLYGLAPLPEFRERMLALLFLFAAGRPVQGGPGDGVKREQLEDLGHWVLTMSDAGVFTQTPLLVSTPRAYDPKQLMDTAYLLVLPMLVALGRLREQYRELVDDGRYLLTAPDSWDAYSESTI